MRYSWIYIINNKKTKRRCNEGGGHGLVGFGLLRILELLPAGNEC